MTTIHCNTDSSDWIRQMIAIETDIPAASVTVPEDSAADPQGFTTSPAAGSPAPSTSGAGLGAERVELRFGPSAQLSRHLRIQLRTNELYVLLYGRRGPGNSRLLAYATGPLSGCRLSIDSTDSALWVNDAAFDLTDSEAARIREVFPTLRIVEAS